MGESGPQDQPGGGWHKFELRAYRVRAGGKFVGLTAADAEKLAPHDTRLFIERIRRKGEIMDATPHTVLAEGDIVAVAGRREVLVDVLEKAAEEVEDPELLAVPMEGVDVLVTHKQLDGMTLAASRATAGSARHFPQQDHPRRHRHQHSGAAADADPPRRHSHAGRPHQRHHRAAKMLGYADKASNIADVAFIGGAIARHADRRDDAQYRRRAADAVDRGRRADRRPACSAGCARCIRLSAASPPRPSGS